jgi:hypothetical protein
MATYSVELYNSQNATQTLVADITSQVKDLRYVVPLNNFEDLSFELDLWAWKSYCASIGIDPYISLKPYTAEIKLRRDGEYLPFVCEIKQAPKAYHAENATIRVLARGTLSKLGDARVSATYSAVDSAAISRDVIALRQAKLFGNFGITNGNTFTTGVPSDRTYVRYVVMDAIRNLSDDASGGFDFFFDHDWKYYTMDERGSLKDDTTYRFGGDDSNVIDYENPEDGTVIQNSVTTVGEGIGDPIESAALIDPISAATYGLRETALIYSSIDNQAWLSNKAEAELRDRKDMYDLPKIVVSGESFDLNTKWVGDTIPLVCTDEASPYTGNGRIKQLSVSVDDNHHEAITVECLKT